MKISICQMAWGRNIHNEEGLIFITEEHMQIYSSLIYTIPLKSMSPTIDNIKSYFIDNEFYFPISQENEFNTIKANVEFPKLSFEIFNIKEVVTFDVEYQIRLKYVGQDITANREEFYFVLVPSELKKMDEIYYKHKIAFVGRTLKFNNE